MKAEDLVKTIEARAAKVAKNDGEEIGAFALIVGPDNAVIDFINIGIVDKLTFAKYLRDQIAARIENVPDGNNPFVTVGGRR